MINSRIVRDKWRKMINGGIVHESLFNVYLPPPSPPINPYVLNWRLSEKKTPHAWGLFPDYKKWCWWEEISPMHSKPSQVRGWVIKLCSVLFGLWNCCRDSVEEAMGGPWRDRSEAEPRRAGCPAFSFSEKHVGMHGWICVWGGRIDA